MNGNGESSNGSKDSKNESSSAEKGNYRGKSGDKNGSEQEKDVGSGYTNQSGSSGGSGGEGNKPPSKSDRNHNSEDEDNEDGDGDTDEEDNHLNDNIQEKEVNGEIEDVKFNVDDLKREFDIPKRKRGRPVGSGKGRRGRRKENIGNRDAVEKRQRKARIPKVYKPSDMIRRERKAISEKTQAEDKIALARKKYLLSIAVKEEDSSWDNEVADTLKSVIQKAKRAKKFKAIGMSRKQHLGDDGFDKKVKTGMSAYPVVQVKKGKGSDSDWDAEAKYTIPGFCCNDCGAVYQSTAALRRHQNYECGKEPQFKCNECDYAAKHKGTLKSHIKNRHLPKGALDESPKKPRKPRRPRITFIPPPDTETS